MEILKKQCIIICSIFLDFASYIWNLDDLLKLLHFEKAESLLKTIIAFIFNDSLIKGYLSPIVAMVSFLFAVTVFILNSLSHSKTGLIANDRIYHILKIDLDIDTRVYFLPLVLVFTAYGRLYLTFYAVLIYILKEIYQYLKKLKMYMNDNRISDDISAKVSSEFRDSAGNHCSKYELIYEYTCLVWSRSCSCIFKNYAVFHEMKKEFDKIYNGPYPVAVQEYYNLFSKVFLNRNDSLEFSTNLIVYFLQQIEMEKDNFMQRQKNSESSISMYYTVYSSLLHFALKQHYDASILASFILNKNAAYAFRALYTKVYLQFIYTSYHEIKELSDLIIYYKCDELILCSNKYITQEEKQCLKLSVFTWLNDLDQSTGGKVYIAAREANRYISKLAAKE